MEHIVAGQKKLLFKAIDNAKLAGKDYSVVASEDKSKDNKKRFLAFESYKDFYNYILSKPVDQRCQYEILPKEKPCLFYVDIDHYDSCGLDIVTKIVESFDKFLTTINLQTGKALVLEANSQTKESYHIIWRTSWALENNKTRRRMFDLYDNYLKETGNALTLCKNATSENNIKILLDPTVYATDTNFRCIHCTKLGANRPLKPMNGFSSENPLDFFIGNLEGHEKILGIEDLPSITTVTKRLKKGNTTTLDNPRKSEQLDDFLQNYDTALPNAFQSEITTIIRDDSLEYISKCIPNGGNGQPWNIWLSVGMALHREAMSSSKTQKALLIAFELFDMWSRTSLKYDAEQTKTSWESFTASYREIGYNRSTLIRLAKQVYPSLFEPDFSPFEDLESDYGKYIEHYNEQYVKPYDPEIQLYFESSPMGSGKTFQIANVIKATKPKRIICLSPKQSFATNFCAKLNDALGYEHVSPVAFVNYLDLMKDGILEKWHNVDRIVIQMESLFKIDFTDFEPYDLLVADEIESLLKCFSSATMLTPIKNCRKSRLVSNFSTFEKIVKTSKSCIFADAFLTKRTLDVINSLRPFDQNTIKIRINDNIPGGRKAVKYGSFKAFEDRMLKELTHNKRIVIFWGSKRRGKEFEVLLKSQLPNKRVKFYHADANDDLDADLEQVNIKWSENVDVLMYSAKITVGINFTIPDYFDHMFVYGYAGGACARDVTQSVLRVRTTKTNTLHYFADGRCYLSECPTTYASLRAMTEWKVQNLQVLEKSMDRKYLIQGEKWSLNMENVDHFKITKPTVIREYPWMTHLYLLNQLEDNLSRTYYHKNLSKYFERCGYVIENDESEEKEEERIKITTVYKDIPTCEDVAVLEAKVQRREASSLEKLILQKAYFEKLVSKDTPDTVLQLLWNTHEVIVMLNRCRRLKYRRLVHIEELKAFTPAYTVQDDVLFKLCHSLGILNPLVETSISLTNFNDCIKYVEENITSILQIFQWKSIGRDKDDDKKIENIIKRVFKETCGGLITRKFKTERRGKTTIRVLHSYLLRNSLTAQLKFDINSILL